MPLKSEVSPTDGTLPRNRRVPSRVQRRRARLTGYCDSAGPYSAALRATLSHFEMPSRRWASAPWSLSDLADEATLSPFRMVCKHLLSSNGDSYERLTKWLRLAAASRDPLSREGESEAAARPLLHVARVARITARVPPCVPRIQSAPVAVTRRRQQRHVKQRSVGKTAATRRAARLPIQRATARPSPPRLRSAIRRGYPTVSQSILSGQEHIRAAGARALLLCHIDPLHLASLGKG
jgi:hypothetical protein